MPTRPSKVSVAPIRDKHMLMLKCMCDLDLITHSGIIANIGKDEAYGK